MNWSKKLIEPISSALSSNGPWARVEEARSGGWYCLAGKKSDVAVNWHHLDEQGNLKKIAAAEDKRIPAIARNCADWISRGYKVQLIAWRVGSRAIFKLQNNHVSSYSKIYRKDRNLLQRWKLLQHSSPTKTLATPDIIEWRAEDKTLIIEDRPGASLNQQWKSGVWLEQHLLALQDVIQWIAGTPPTESIPQHTIADEIKILKTRSEVFHRILKNPHPKAKELVKRTISALENLGETEMILAHRDLHDKQILTSSRGTTLLDLDLLAVADPALDPGNIIAHCRLRVMQGCPIPWEKLASDISRSAKNRGISRDRMIAWTASTLCRLALIYSRRERYDGFIDGILKSLAALLDDRGEWDGVLE